MGLHRSTLFDDDEGRRVCATSSALAYVVDIEHMTLIGLGIDREAFGELVVRCSVAGLGVQRRVT